MQALTTTTRITVGAPVHFPHRCAGRMSRCDGQTATIAQLTNGGFPSRPGDRFAHLSAGCGLMRVVYTTDLGEVA